MAHTEQLEFWTVVVWEDQINVFLHKDKRALENEKNWITVALLLMRTPADSLKDHGMELQHLN